LSFHPRILAALERSARQSGFGMGASRRTTGSTDEVLTLERDVAKFAGAGDAIVTGSGTMANAGVIDGLRGLVDHWVIDEQAHSSFKNFLPISGARVLSYRHLDVGDLSAKLDGLAGRVGIYSDAVFPLTGEIAPREDIERVAGPALCVFDEAHSFGVEPSRLGSNVLVTATFTKSLGCSGGMILGEARWIEQIRERSEILASTGALSPSLSAAASEALAVVREEPERVARLKANVLLMSKCLAIPCPKAPIFFQIQGAQEASAQALEAGFLVPRVTSYPGAPAEGMLRWIVSSEHTAGEIRTVSNILSRL
jgi:8-amino-7-oxononanoate synthase